jgi:hypothetical protein
MLKKRLHYLLPLLWLASLPLNASGDYLTPETWDATATTFTDGRLKYRQFDFPVAPGIKDTATASKDLIVDSGANLRDTIVKAPETMVVIYDSGIVDNFLQYKGMVAANWAFSKLASGDFSDAKDAYVREGNWGIIQSSYYVLKGSSRVVWAVALLNSGEAIYQIVKATGETVYYLVRYPVTGVVEVAAAPVVLVGGTAWSTAASGVTTGWALPVTATIDGVKYLGEGVWAK